MRKFQIIIITGVLFFLAGRTITAQNQEYLLDTLPELEVIDPQIYRALDTVLFYTKDCIFSILNRPYHFWIDFWWDRDNKQKIVARIQATPYYGSLLNTFRRETNKARRGFFYYKDYLVIVDDRSAYNKEAIYPLFFKKTDSTQVLYYSPSPDNPDRQKGGEFATIYYQYRNGNLEEEERDICRDYPHYFYQIKENDTWESIANKLKCTVEELQNIQGVYEEKLPPVGTNILFRYYRIDDGKMKVERTR